VSIDPLRDPARIRDVAGWPQRPWLPVERWIGDHTLQHALIHEDATRDGEDAVVVYGATDGSMVNLTTGALTNASELPSLAEYDSIEHMISDGWTVAR
jgi:hypothetical protein